jgi:hypothetical protein
MAGYYTPRSPHSSLSIVRRHIPNDSSLLSRDVCRDSVIIICSIRDDIQGSRGDNHTSVIPFESDEIRILIERKLFIDIGCDNGDTTDLSISRNLDSFRRRFS